MDTETTVRIEKKEPDGQNNANGETADSLLRQAATHSPEVIGFADPPNRADFGIGPAQSVSFAEADALVARVAAGFARHGLEPGDVVAFQLPNTWESALFMIGAWRARLIAVPLPMMWRVDELHHAVAQINPKAIITMGRFAGHDHARTMREAVARHISVRYIFGLGADLPDGITPIGDWLASDGGGSEADVQTVRAGSPGDVALMTWAASTSGVHPVPRTHSELLAVGRVAAAELQLTNTDILLNAYPLTGIAAVAGQLMAALLTAIPLHFHLPFDYDTFVAQLCERKITYTAVPAPVIAALMERGDMERPGLALTRIGCVRPLPSDLGSGAVSGFPVPVYTIHSLSELALIIGRDNSERPTAGLPLGQLFSSNNGSENTCYLETRVRGSVAKDDSQQRLEGELFVRGLTVPGGPLDNAGALTQALLVKDTQGYLNTRIPCFIDDTMDGCFRCRRDGELLYHGGVAVPAGELDKTYADYPEFLDAAAFAIEDPVMGERIFAAVVPRPDQTPSLADFRRFLEAKGIAAYKCPDQLVIVNAIPRSPDGSVLRGQILNQI